jgi:hypothetical protein
MAESDETVRLLFEENEELGRQVEKLQKELRQWRNGAKSVMAAMVEQRLANRSS